MSDRLTHLAVQLRWKLRSLLPDDTPKQREIQGVKLWMPRAHRLGDFAAVAPEYGQNIVRLAAALDPGSPLQLIDVGANIGDTTAQVLATRPGTALCVEADAYWLPFLQRNLDESTSTIAFHLLVPSAQVGATATRPVRNNQGTTTFAEGTDPSTAPAIAIGDLPASYPDFDRVRLVKSDTDGYDAALIPALAETYAASTPALFFEYDERLTRNAGNANPDDMFTRLVELGYDRFVAWDNWGALRSTFTGTNWTDAIGQLRDGVAAGRWDFWDVAAAHRDDPAGIAAVESFGTA